MTGVTPLGNPFPALDYATEAALRASIKTHGVLVPIVEDQHGRTLDGHHRRRLADQLGVPYDINVIETRDDGHARELSVTLNADRRHLTPEQRKAAAATLREEGHSLRAIGGALGVSEGTIRADLKQVRSATHLTPDRVTGRDGKTYPARPKPRRRRTKRARAERPLLAVFHTAIGDATDVLERDPTTLANLIPAQEHDQWASILHNLATHATALAEQLAPGDSSRPASSLSSSLSPRTPRARGAS